MKSCFIVLPIFAHKAPNHIASCTDDVTCSNGCCRNNSCLNGGTCIELCEPTSVRFNCSCPVAFTGKYCEIQVERNQTNQDISAAGSNSSGLFTAKNDSNHTDTQQRRSCQDYKEAGSNSSGLFTVIDGNNKKFQVFCDFHSEPGFSWNLIESFSLSNKHLFQVVFLTLID